MIPGLTFLHRTSSRSTWTLAAYHPPTSMTWLWALSFKFFKADEGRWRPLFWLCHPSGQQRWGLRVPGVGILSWFTQKPMMNEHGAAVAIEQAVRRVKGSRIHAPD